MNKELKISTRFYLKFQENEKWGANVEQVIINTKDYFYCSPKFFPEYTHHGILHIRRVLEICDKLVSDKALSNMTARDLGILIISVIMHDIGMFIDSEGLGKLLYGEHSERKTRRLDKRTWKEEWICYLQAIERSSDKKLRKIFGDTGCPEELPFKETIIKEKNALLYGEFLRQNHGRLAFEIVKYGFPGSIDLDVFRKTEIDDEIRDIIAIVARSHTIALRQVVPYLEGQYTLAAEPKNIKIFYLMSLLRMADYLDAGYDRASHVIELMRGTKSEISAEEFSWNQVIDYDDYSWRLESETLIIHANPRCSSQFLKIENWLNELQKELDLCWAVLGEFYTGKSPLELTIRRVNSNILLENTRKRFEERFVTRRAVLDTNPDILKLLIHPLYDEEAKYGIRELLQNAVDACNEREELESRRNNISYHPQIRVEINRDRREISVLDNGIGMTADIIINYFLISGASFRNSEIWEKNYIKNGESVIARSGKFGIGVLSAFLLGNHVEVTTRHLSEDLGYSFGIEIGRENINIERTAAPIGTKLVVRSSLEILEEIVSGTEYPKWTDWYCFQKPVVEYILDGQEIYHEEEYVPNTEEEFEGWYLLEGTEYVSYKWSYDAKHLSGINAFCNGIPVTQGTVLDAAKYGFPLKTPIISIVDYNNKVHINLSRNQLTSFPAEKDFVREGYRFAIMRLLEEEFINARCVCSQALQKGFVYYERLNVEGNSSVHVSQYLFSEEGYTLMSPAFLKHSGVKELLLVCMKSNGIEDFYPQLSSIPIWLCELGTFRRRSFFCRAFTSIFEEKGIYEEAVQFIVDKQFYDIELEDYFAAERVTEKMELCEQDDGIYNFILGGGINDLDSELNWRNLMEQGALAVIRYRLDFSEDSNLMEKLLKQYLNDITWIPYTLEKRERVCSKIFDELGIYSKNEKRRKG